jgi:serine/threonine protein kinase
MDLSKLGKKDYENIVKEIESHKQMDHPNIIKMIDFMKVGKMVYILLEYVKKGNLFYYLTEKKKLHENEVAKFFFQTCKAIEHVHNKKFIHRDLKPENVLLDSDFNIKLCDFGWCSSLSDKEYRYVVGGTYEYMAPESIKNSLQGPEVDIWALGVLLYELFHNREPYRGKSTREILKSILSTEL